MAIELFKPFVMKELVQNGTAHNIKNAKKMVERLQPEVWDVLEDVNQRASGYVEPCTYTAQTWYSGI